MPLAQPTGIQPSQAPVDLGNPDERRRLTGPALKAFFRIVAAWGLNAEEARSLIGGMSNGKYQDLKRRIDDGNLAEVRPLGQDALQRISYVVGVTKALRILHGTDIADSWMTLPNTNPMFSGARPMDLVLREGIPALAEIRRLLDARRGMNA